MSGNRTMARSSAERQRTITIAVSPSVATRGYDTDARAR